MENARFCFILRAKLKLFDLHFNECNISCSRNASLGFVPGAEGKKEEEREGGYNLNAYTGSKRESGACSEFTDALTFELITMNAATQANAIATVNVNVNVNMNQTGTYTHILSLLLQVSTPTGIISHFVNLQVVVPEAFILGSGELHVDMGSTINLVCIIEKVSLANHCTTAGNLHTKCHAAYAQYFSSHSLSSSLLRAPHHRSTCTGRRTIG